MPKKQQQPQASNNAEVQEEVKQIEQSIILLMNEIFVGLDIDAVITVDVNGENDTIGSLISKNDRIYEFMISADDQLPVIWPFLGDIDEGEESEDKQE